MRGKKRKAKFAELTGLRIAGVNSIDKRRIELSEEVRVKEYQEEAGEEWVVHMDQMEWTRRRRRLTWEDCVKTDLVV